MSTTRKVLLGLVASVTLASMALLAPTATPPASAASLVQVTNFGDNPGNLQMHIYVPDTGPTPRPIVLAMHPCGGNGPSFYASTEFASLADRYGFIVIYPTASNRRMNCFDNWSDESKIRGGRTDPVSLVSMVNYAVQQYGGDPNRVYATGSSSGAMMTNALLALYPDVFKAGAAFMGVPFACFPNEADYQPGGNSNCSNARINRTPQEWGDLVRQANPTYRGPWPRIQLWHGTNDFVVAYGCLQQEVDQWTNVHGLSTTPTSTDYPQPNWVRQRYADSTGTVQVEAITITGAGHNLPMGGMAAYAISFFGLDGTVPTSTPTTPSNPPITSSPPGSTGACRVTVNINAWNNGLTADITIVNTSTSTINGWSLTFTLASGQTIVSGWNATYSPPSGQVTARNVSYNATIPPNGSTVIGFQATHTGNTDRPSSFALNGTPCSVF